MPSSTPPWHMLLFATPGVSLASAGARPLVTGDLAIWDALFASRSHRVLLDGPANGIYWTEAPLVLGDELVFSDVIGDRTCAVDIKAAMKEDHAVGGRSEYLRVVKERSGESPAEEYQWRAEPGGNGLAALPGAIDDIDETNPSIVILCQHGARRLVTVDLNSGLTQSVVASKYQGKQLNGPNDVFARAEEDEDGNVRTYAYFTDPVYAWLEKERFEDLPYLDEKVRTEGPGHCGVYRVEISEPAGSTELITSNMNRPNGIEFDGDDLIVAECCQGSHLDHCKSGTSRWEILRRQTDGSWAHVRIIEDAVSSEEAAGGCADGFAVYIPGLGAPARGRRGNARVLLASCFGGLCVVDLESGGVLARMWTARDEHGGCRISNVAIGEGHAFLTGSCGVFALPLNKWELNTADSPDESLDAEL